MKSRYNKTTLLLTLCSLLIVGSCQDEALYDMGNHRNTGKNILFDVTSGLSFQSTTRSDDEEDYNELDPIKLPIEKDTLYLHRYVSAEYERATGRGASTRALPINNLTDFKSLNEGNFWVSAYFPEDDNREYFPLSIATPLPANLQNKDEDLWSLNPIPFWPEDKLRFYAVAPASVYNKDDESLLKDLSINHKNDNNKPSISFDYTVPYNKFDEDGKRADALNQPDIMFAINESQYTTADGGDLADINFRHALSAIKFAVRDVAKFKIVDISIKGVAGSGHCEFTGGENGGFKWSDLGEATAVYTQRFDYSTTDPYPGIPSTENKSLEPIPTDKPEYTFMLIPQKIDNATLEITIEYYAETPDSDEPATELTRMTLEGKLNPGQSQDNTGTDQDNTTSNQNITEWEPGKEYVYTISTSAINWSYVFKVMGSVQGVKTYDKNKHEWKNGKFTKDPKKIEIGAGVTKGSSYEVTSYRYRTNNPSIIEPLPWTAEIDEINGEAGGINSLPPKFEEYKTKIPNLRTPLPTGDWLLKNWVYSGDGTTMVEKEDEDGNIIKEIKYEDFTNLEFADQYVATDYKGDWEMREKQENGSEKGPIDLSLSNGGIGVRNTANCYVINAGGWYSIPLYYGSSIKNGNVDESTYIPSKNDVTWRGTEYPSLKPYVDYAGNAITQAEITTPVEDAILVWQDAYHIVDNVRFEDSERQIVFHVDPTYLQQANCVLAIRDKDEKIIWSWHIWVTDHWVNDNLVLGQRVGREADVTCDAKDPSKGPFDLAPYNLGWCDHKNVLYLQRSGTMTFTQTQSDKKTVLATKTLEVIQRADEIEYWIGNSTYYQFGRKDPMVGFINAESKEKYNFGSEPYAAKVVTDCTVQDCILAPNTFFDSSAYFDNWTMSKYNNLWNNYESSILVPGEETVTTRVPNKDINTETLEYWEEMFDKYKKGELTQSEIDNLNALYIEFTSFDQDGEAIINSGNPIFTQDYEYSAIKTIYDPSPAGYVIPPIGFFQIFGIGNPNSGGLLAVVNNESFYVGKIGRKEDISNIPSNVENPGLYFNYTASPRRDHTPPYSVIFNVNGQKRKVDTNMNPQMVYLWSNTPGFYDKVMALGYVLGYDPSYFNLNTYFQGLRRIARPIRCIKEKSTSSGN